MKFKQNNRRSFLKNGAVLAGFALGTPASQSYGAQTPDDRIENLHKYGERSHFVNFVRISNRTPLQDSVGMITPASHSVRRFGGWPDDVVAPASMVLHTRR